MRAWGAMLAGGVLVATACDGDAIAPDRDEGGEWSSDAAGEAGEEVAGDSVLADGEDDEGPDAVVDGPGVDSSAGAQIGDPCSSAESCPAGGSGTPVCLDEWPGGYCAVDACTDHGHDCPEDPGLGGTATTGGKCVLAPAAKCLALCAGDADCREGYACRPRGDAAGHGEANVCVPEAAGGTDAGMGGDGSGGDGMGGDGMMGGDGGGM